MSDPSTETAGDPRPGLKQLLEDYERRLILSALQRAGGSQRRAAKLLGVLPTTLSEKMKRLGLRTDRGDPPAPALMPRDPDHAP